MTRTEFQELYDEGPEVLYGLFHQMEQTIVTLQQTVSVLSSRVQELEDRLRKDSHNSSKPPSSDGYAKKPSSLRETSGKKPGGQTGHKGTTLCLSETPDNLVPHEALSCSCCGTCLADVPQSGYERRQVYDLPPLSLLVTEHRAEKKICPLCQTETTAVFPEGVTQPVQYGPKIKGLLVYLNTYQMLPYHRIGELVFDLFGACPCEGTLFTSLATAYEALAPVEAAIRQAVLSSPVVGFDETGMRIENKLNWLHSAGTKTLTLYFHHPKRGRKAMDELSVLPAFTGVAVHDGYPSYFQYAECSHALCNAHHLRELTFLKGQPEQPWAEGLIDLLVEIKRAVDTNRDEGQTQLSRDMHDDFLLRYDRFVKDGLERNPPAMPTGQRGKVKQTPATNLLIRLKKHRDSALLFMERFDVPFDNNQSERDLRMMKVKQKVSGSFRSQQGADFFCRIRGYIATLRKQGRGTLDALQNVFQGAPLITLLDG